MVAESEHAVIQASQNVNPTSANSDKPSLASLIAPLSEAIKVEKSSAEDKFQARVCLGWIYWLGGKPELACSNLPKSIEQDFAQLDGTGQDTAAWTKVCALKASYIKGTSLVKTTAAADALQTFESALPILSSVTSKSLDGSSEQRTWTELLLTQLCLLSSSAIKTKLSSLVESETLSAFRAWGNFWERQRGQASLSIGGYAVNSDIARRQVWKEYYVILTTILQQGLPYPTTSMATAYTDASTRLLQRAELQRIESKYEELLLQEVQFPMADETNEEVEEWAELVVQNWRVFCGSEWQEYDSDQNGREAISRRVLDILYRAATKTFHSTSILRHLFTVHLAVGEFDMAFKAFDTYLEIVKKGKARVEKTGEMEKGLDDDETVLMTASQCIQALCRYGSRDAAEKAKDIGHYFEEWLRKHYPQTGAENNINGHGDGKTVENGDTHYSTASISAPILAAAWRSIGIGKAQWARYTYDAASRSDIQKEAIESLRKALLSEHDSIDDTHTFFALAMVLSERRQLDAAISVVKKALSPPSSMNTSDKLGSHGGQFTRERSLIPLWHLLALLLSARQEFAIATRACEGAFEQFKEPKNLFGDMEVNETYRSEHLNLQVMSEKSSSHRRGLVDYMDDFEKETVLELKMTQLVLVEVQEGPQVAVNASDELLSLYTRLFGEPQKTYSIAPQTSQSVAPQSSAGTLKSIKGSIFSRSRKSVHKSSDTRGRASSLNEKSDLPVRPQTAQTHASTTKAAPIIHVTNENGGTTTQPHEHEKLQKRSASLSRKKSHGSVRNRSASAGPAHTEKRTVSATHGEHTTLHRETSQRLRAARLGRDGPAISSIPPSVVLAAQQEGSTTTSSTPLPLSSQPMLQKEESLKAKSHSRQDTRLPYMSAISLMTNPPTRFPLDQERRRRIGILIKVWLLISGFYRRAELYDDSKGAIDEAYKLAEGLELDVSRDMSGNVSIYDGGWGNLKCVEELWGDIWSEVSVPG